MGATISMSEFGSSFRLASLIHREISSFLSGAPSAAKVPLHVIAQGVLRELPEVPLAELTEVARRAAAEVGREIAMDGAEDAVRDGGDAGQSDGSRHAVAALVSHTTFTEGLAMDDRESRIRQRAYRLWEQDGWPTGMEAEHWARAERELFSKGHERPEQAGSGGNGSAEAGFSPAFTPSLNGGEPVSEAATQSAVAGKSPAVKSKPRATKSAGTASSRTRPKAPK